MIFFVVGMIRKKAIMRKYIPIKYHPILMVVFALRYGKAGLL
jgi:hypothetical protein